MKSAIPQLYDQLIHSPFIVGFAGAITSMLANGKVPFWRKVSMSVSGMLMAGYMSPLVWMWFGVETVEYKNAVVFLVGMLGMQIAGGIIVLGEDIRNNPGKYIPQRWKKQSD